MCLMVGRLSAGVPQFFYTWPLTSQQASLGSFPWWSQSYKCSKTARGQTLMHRGIHISVCVPLADVQWPKQVTLPTSIQGMQNSLYLWLGGFGTPLLQECSFRERASVWLFSRLPLPASPLAPFSFSFLVCIIYISRLSAVLYLGYTSLIRR